MAKDMRPSGLVNIPHRKAQNYAAHPLTGFLVSKGENGQPWILHAYADVPDIESEDFTPVGDGKTMAGAGVHQRMARIDVAAFLVSEASLRVLAEYLKKEFKDPEAAAQDGE